MGRLIADKSYEMLSGSFSGLLGTSEEKVELGSKNLIPDPGFFESTDEGTTRYQDLAYPPAPDGWGLYVRDTNEVTTYSEQNGAPLLLGEEPFYDLDHPLIIGPGLPGPQDIIPITTPDLPRATIRITGERGFEEGWYTAAYSWSSAIAPNGNITRITLPSPRTAPFQLGPTTGIAFTIPDQPSKDAEWLIIFLSERAGNAIDAANAPMWQQGAVRMSTNRDSVFILRGYRPNTNPAPTNNSTKVMRNPEAFMVNTMDIPNDQRGKNTGDYRVRFAYSLLDGNGESRMGSWSGWRSAQNNQWRYYRVKPDPDRAVDPEIKAQVRFKLFVAYQELGKKGVKIGLVEHLPTKAVTFPIDGPPVDVNSMKSPVYGYSQYGYTTGNGKGQDTTGVDDPTEPLEIFGDEPVLLNASGLTPGLHYFRQSLYYQDKESPASEPLTINITETNQIPRIHEPMFQNRMDNPNLIEIEAEGKPRGWQMYGQEQWRKYYQGRIETDETRGRNVRENILATPYGYIKANEGRDDKVRVIVEMAKVQSGKAVVEMHEYKPNPSFNEALAETESVIPPTAVTSNPKWIWLQRTVLGKYYQNGRYEIARQMTKRMDGRDAINLHNDTTVVRIVTVGDGSDPEFNFGGHTGMKYEMYQTGHGVFRDVTPKKRKRILRKYDKITRKMPWREPEEPTYPHGGYCNVIDNGEDIIATGLDFRDGVVAIADSADLTTTARTTRTIEARIQTGNDVTTESIIYREGNDTAGYAIGLINGTINARMWDSSGTSFAQTSASVNPNQKYMITVVHDMASGGSKLKIYVDGLIATSTAGFDTVAAHAGGVSIGRNNGTVRTFANASSTATLPFYGKVYEVRVWNSGRTIDEVFDTYDIALSPSEETNLAAYYDINEMEGTSVFDTAGSNLGTISGRTRWITDVPDAGYIDSSVTTDLQRFENGLLPATWTWTATGATNVVSKEHSVSRHSHYGVQISGTGTNFGYLSRAVPSNTDNRYALGAAINFRELPTSGTHRLMELLNGAGTVAHLSYDASTKRLNLTSKNGTVAIVDRGLENTERKYIEFVANTGNGRITVYMGDNSERELTPITHITDATIVGQTPATATVGVSTVTGTPANTWKYKIGEIRLSRFGINNKDYLPGNFIEYYGPYETPQSPFYGHTGLRIPVKPNTQYTASVYAMCADVAVDTWLMNTSILGVDGGTVANEGALVEFADTQEEWQRYTLTFTTPADAAYLKFDQNNVGGGVYRVQAPQVEEGASATAFTATKNTTGSMEIVFDSFLPGVEQGDVVDSMNKVLSLLNLDYTGTKPENTTVKLEVTSGGTPTGPWSGYTQMLDKVHRHRYYKVRVTLETEDNTVTPTIESVYLHVERPYPMFLRDNGSEYYGGTLVNELSAPAPRRLMEVTDMQDGSHGFVAWGPDEAYKWFPPMKLTVFRDTTATEIQDSVGKGESAFMVEYNRKWYKIRVLEPIEFKANRFQKKVIDGAENFYTHEADVPTSLILESGDLEIL